MRISRSPASNFWAKQGPQRPEPKQLQTIESKVSLKTSSIWLVTCPTQIVAKTGNKTHEDIGTFSAVKASFAHFYHAASKHLYYVFKIIRSFSKHQQKTSRGRWFCCSILQHSKAVHCLCPMSRKKSIKKNTSFSACPWQTTLLSNSKTTFHETLRLDMSWQLAVGLGHLRPWLFLGPSRRERQLPTAWCPTSHGGMGSEVASSTKLQESTMTVLFYLMPLGSREA